MHPISHLLIGWTLASAAGLEQRGRSPLELLSARADAALAKALRARFGQPSQEG